MPLRLYLLIAKLVYVRVDECLREYLVVGFADRVWMSFKQRIGNRLQEEMLELRSVNCFLCVYIYMSVNDTLLKKELFIYNQ